MGTSQSTRSLNPTTLRQMLVAVLLAVILLAAATWVVRVVLPPLEVPAGGGTSGGVSGRSGSIWTFATTACLAGIGSAVITDVRTGADSDLVVRAWGVRNSPEDATVGASTRSIADLPGYDTRRVSQQCGGGSAASLAVEVEGPKGARSRGLDVEYEVRGITRTARVAWTIGLT